VKKFEARLMQLQQRLGVRVQPRFGGLSGLPGQIAGQTGQEMASTSRPTEVQLRVRGELEQELRTVLEEVEDAISKAFPELQRLVATRRLQPTLVPR
jgi:hypothetical protein